MQLTPSPYDAIVKITGDQIIAYDPWSTKRSRRITSPGEAGVDDADIVNAAITAKTNAILIGTIQPSETIVIPANKAITIQEGSIVQTLTDNNIFQLAEGSQLIGGRIDASLTGFDSSAVIIDGTPARIHFTGKTRVINVKILGDSLSTGTGICMHVGDATPEGCIEGVQVQNCNVQDMEYGILQLSDASTSDPWINGNAVNNCWISSCKYHVKQL